MSGSISLDYSDGFYMDTEIEKVDKKIIGIYVLYNKKSITETKTDIDWIFWGSGNIYQGLKSFQSNPCNFQFVPIYFGYITKYGDSNEMLAKLKSECGQKCQ